MFTHYMNNACWVHAVKCGWAQFGFAAETFQCVFREYACPSVVIPNGENIIPDPQNRAMFDMSCNLEFGYIESGWVMAAVGVVVFVVGASLAVVAQPCSLLSVSGMTSINSAVRL